MYYNHSNSMVFSARNSILRISSTIKRLKKSMNLKFKIDFQFFFSMVREKTASLWYSKQFHNWSKYFSIFAPIKIELKARNTAKILWLVCIECHIFYELDNWNNQKKYSHATKCAASLLSNFSIQKIWKHNPKNNP